MPAAIARRLQPEMLDILPAGDPRAVRCRRDLRLINWVMGNHRWVARMLSRHVELVRKGVVELGAGDGTLLQRLRRRFPTVPLAGFDRVSRPSELPPGIQWHSGDLFHHAGPWPGAVLVANLFIHHFSSDQIANLGTRLDGIQLLLIGEGYRSPEVLRRSCWLNPFLGEVTRNDMEISLAAGFVEGELPEWLGLSDREWLIREYSTLLGAHRLLAIRKWPVPWRDA